jgi:hypothetical protein
MTYQQIKETLVKKEKLLTSKQLRKFIIKWALLVFGLSLILVLPTFSLLGSRLTLIIVIIAGLLFINGLNLIVDEPDLFEKMNKYVSLWWISYIVVVLVYLVLKFFNFM